MEYQSIYSSWGIWHDYLSNNLSYCRSWYNERSLISRFLIALMIPACLYVYSVCMYVKRYPCVLYMKTSSSSDIYEIRPIRLEDEVKMVINHVMTNYNKIILSKEIEEFKFTWSFDDKESSKLVSTEIINNVLINSILLKEKNNELITLRNNNQNNHPLFNLSQDGRMLTLQYNGRKKDEDKDETLKHLLWIRDECQIIEQGNNDRHDLRLLSSGLESMILNMKSPNDWTKEERSYLTKPWSSSTDHDSNESNRSKLRISWYDKVWMNIVDWGSGYVKDLGYLQNPNAIRNIIDPHTGLYAGRYTPDPQDFMN